jgi:hypothetical protein
MWHDKVVDKSSVELVLVVVTTIAQASDEGVRMEVGRPA